MFTAYKEFWITEVFDGNLYMNINCIYTAWKCLPILDDAVTAILNGIIEIW